MAPYNATSPDETPHRNDQRSVNDDDDDDDDDDDGETNAPRTTMECSPPSATPPPTATTTIGQNESNGEVPSCRRHRRRCSPPTNNDGDTTNNTAHPKPRFAAATNTITASRGPATRNDALSLPALWAHSLQRKASVWDGNAWAAVSLTLDGRDKLTKVLQYLARFLAWYLQSTNNKGWLSNQAARFKALKTALATSRKAFRLGRTWIECHKLRQMGLIPLVRLHWRQQQEQQQEHHQQQLSADAAVPTPLSMGKECPDDYTKNHKNVVLVPSNPATLSSDRHGTRALLLMRRLSSNLGWSLPDVLEELEQRLLWRQGVGESSSPSCKPASRLLLRQVSHMAVRAYRVLSSFGGDAPTLQSRAAYERLWQSLAALKLMGLAGHWASDNVHFLTSAGVLDNFQLSPADRAVQRKPWLDRTNRWATQTYFVAAMAGLVLNWRSYRQFQQKQQQTLLQYNQESDNDEDEAAAAAAEAALVRARDQKVKLLLALVKSSCDIVVFSNNAGVDVWKRYRGAKLPETVHCLAGLVSAATVLYNQFPPASSPLPSR